MADTCTQTSKDNVPVVCKTRSTNPAVVVGLPLLHPVGLGDTLKADLFQQATAVERPNIPAVRCGGKSMNECMHAYTTTDGKTRQHG